ASPSAAPRPQPRTARAFSPPVYSSVMVEALFTSRPVNELTQPCATEARSVGEAFPRRKLNALHPGADALFQVSDDLVGDARVDILLLVAHGPVSLFWVRSLEPPRKQGRVLIGV